MIENETIFYENWFEKGIVFVNDVLNTDGSIMKLKDFKSKHRMKVPSLTYDNLKAAIAEWVIKENVTLSKSTMSHMKYIKKWVPLGADF